VHVARIICIPEYILYRLAVDSANKLELIFHWCVSCCECHSSGINLL